MTTKTETLQLPPSADLDGAWEGIEPLLVDAIPYERVEILAAYSKAYEAGDGTGPGTDNFFILPDLGTEQAAQDIVVVDSTEYDTGAYETNHPFKYPAKADKPILEGDLILVATTTWSSAVTGAPATPSGFTSRGSWKDAGDTYSPRLTLFYKVATGSESGEIDIDISGVSSGAPLSGVVVVYRGVDQSSPWSTSTAGPDHANAPNPDGDAITPAHDGARVLSIVAARRWNGDPSAQPPASFSIDVEQFGNPSRGVSIAGLESTATEVNPGAWDYETDAYTVITEALRPAETYGTELTLLLAVVGVGGVSAVGGAINGLVEGTDEVQTISSSLGSGTFTLSFDGDTTGALDFDATAAEIETELLGLTSLPFSGDVIVSGGPLDQEDVYVEFRNTRSAEDVPLITTSSGSVTVTETVEGVEAIGFSDVADAEIPRTNGSGSPEMQLMALTTEYIPGRRVGFLTGPGAFKTWAAFLLICSKIDTVAPVADATEATPGEGQSLDLGSITPTDSGVRVLSIVSKALETGNYPVAASGVSRPSGTVRAAGAVGDSCSIDGLLSGPVPAVERNLGLVAWPIIEKYSAVTVSLVPASPATAGIDTYEVLGAGTDRYMEVGHATSNLYHVVEVGLDSIPSDAVLVAGTVQFTHESDDEHEIQVILVGINSDGTIEPCEEQGRGFVALPLGSVVQAETVRWTETADGSPLNDFNRLGIAFVSTSTAPALTEHRVYSAVLELEYVAGGPVVANVVGPTDAGDPLATWDYESAGGLPQVYYEVMVIRGNNQDPLLAVDDDPWQGTTGNKVFHSGLLTGPDVRSFSLTDYPLYNGDNTVAVRAWTRINGALVSSDWSTDNFNITGSPPSAPTFSSGPALNADTGAVEMTVNTPASVSRAFVAKSTDGGTTFALVAHGGPFEVTPSSTATVRDPNPVTGEAALYRVIVDDGETSESNWVNWSGPYTPTLTEWYLVDPTDEALAMDIFVVDVEVERSKRTVRSRQEGRSAVGSSGQLGDIIRATIRVITPTERATLESMIQSDNVLWLADPLGRSWYVRPGDSSDYQMLRTAPTGDDLANIRDAHDITVELVEVGL